MTEQRRTIASTDHFVISRRQTRIELSHALSELTGRPVYIKREDLADTVCSGNKVGKIMYLFDDLRNKHVTDIIADGTTQSNSLMSLSHYAPRYGFNTHFIVYGSKDKIANYREISKKHNQLYQLDTWDDDAISRLRRQITESISQAGGLAENIPTGLSSPKTIQAAIDIANEISDFEHLSNVSFDRIFVAAGTGSTVAGLSYGDQMNTSKNRVVGVVVANNLGYFEKETAQYFLHLSKQLNQPTLHKPSFDVSMIGSGYAQFTSNDTELQRRFYKQGVFFDNVYMLKTVKALLGYAETSRSSRPLLLVHTGGYNQLELVMKDLQ
jgi:D-cysteine desulfhydrase